MALITNNISGSISNNSKVGITGSVIIANVPNSSFPSMPGADTVFYVSGSINSIGTTTKGAAVFGGDVLSSGSIVVLGNTTLGNSLVDRTSITGSLATTGNVTLGDSIVRITTVSGDLNVNQNATIAGDLAVNGGDMTSTAGTFNLLNNQSIINVGTTTSTTQLINIGGAQTTGWGKSINIGTDGFAGSSVGVNLGSSTPGVSSLTTANGNLLVTNILGVNGGDITTTSTFANIFDTNALYVTFARVADAISIGDVRTLGQTIDIGTGTTAGGSTKSLNLATNGANGSTTNITLGSSTAGAAGTTSINSQTGVNVGITTGASIGADTFLFVSGSIGSKGTSTKGTALFGGDVVISGSVATLGDVFEMTGSLTVTNGISGSLTRLANGTSYLIAGNNITITSQSNGSVTISAAPQFDDFFDSTTAGSIFTTGSVAFRGSESSIDSPSDKGTDVFFYVSGSISGSAGTFRKALFGGDVVISGSLTQGLQNTAGDGALGKYSHAEGRESTASGEYSHAEGYRGLASGLYSHAEGGSADATGTYSHAEGEVTVASGVAAHAEGYGTIATGDASHAEGEGSESIGYASHAEGRSTFSRGLYSHAEGRDSESFGSYSHTEGRATIASGSYQHVEGQYNLRDNNFSLMVIGNGTGDANNLRSDIVRVNQSNVQISGSFIQANSGSSTVGFMGGEVGTSSTKGADVFFYVSGTVGARNGTTPGVALFGGDLIVSGAFATQGDVLEVTGTLSVTSGISGSLTRLTNGTSYLIAGNNISITTGSTGAVTITGLVSPQVDDFFDSTTAGSVFTTGSFAFRGSEAAIDSPIDKGTDVFFYVSGSTASGRNFVSLFGGSVIASGSLVQGNFGASGGATGQYSHAEGERTNATGTSSHAEGRFCASVGSNSHAEGDSTVSNGAGSHAEGLSTTAQGAYSHAEGQGSYAGGNYSHAEGIQTTSEGTHSHAEGIVTFARAVYSHAEGERTEVVSTGRSAHAEGFYSVARGQYSHAEGSGSISLGEASHAEGLVTIASGSYQHTQGRYNLRNNDFSLMVIGNGTGDLNSQRSDIIRVNLDSVQISGSFIQANSGSSTIGFMGNEVGTAVSKGPDVFFYVSGSGGTKDTSTRGVALFGGDVVISGTLYGGSPLKIGTDVQVNGSVNVNGSYPFISPSISGSLTKLTDGTSYLVAGTNVVITSQSNGAILVEAATLGGPGGISGVNTYVQFNDGGVFGSDADFTFNNTTNTLSATNVKSTTLTGSLTRLIDGSSYLVAGGGISILSSSNGSITVSNPTTYSTSFTSANLTAGVLTVTHNLGKKYVQVTVYDNTDYMIIPDQIYAASENSTQVTLTSFSVVGTWNVSIRW